MNRKLVLTLTLTLLVGTLGIVFNVQRAKAIGTIYIRADGSIDPPTPLIATVDNVTYILTGNITSDADGILIERDNITIDGNGCTLQGSGSGNGFYWSVINNVTVRSTIIRDFACGFYLSSASLSHVFGNTITNSPTGVDLRWGSNNTFSENIITNSITGVDLRWGSDNHAFFGNTITNSTNCGVYFESCNNNTFSANTIEDSGHGVFLDWGSSNNNFSENTITESYDGVNLGTSSNNNTFFGNTITKSTNCGIHLRSSNNIISGNTITESYYGIYLDSNGNEIYHNNFINNTIPAYATVSAIWDYGYPSGGNYWSDYLTKYPNATEIDDSGIGDTPYVIGADSIDHYPLMTQYVIPEFSPFIILPLFFIATLLAVIVYRRKLFYSTGR